MYLGNHISKKQIFILLIIFLFSINLPAQITFEEPKKNEEPKKEELPKWWCKKDEIFAPYDSIYERVERYPTLDAYNKYIGQELCLIDYPNCAILFSNNESLKEGIFVYKGDRFSDRFSGELYRNDFKEIANKYYKIIDITSQASDEYKKHHYRHEECPSERFDKYSWKCDNNLMYSEELSLKKSSRPYFVMIERSSGDTVYTCRPEKFIIVGWFVKTRKELIGKKIITFDYKESDTKTGASYSFYDFPINGKWKCIDLIVNTKSEIVLVVQNEEDTTLQKTIQYGAYIYNGNWETYYGTTGRFSVDRKYWATDSVYNKISAEEEAAFHKEMKRLQETGAKEQQKREQEQQKIQQAQKQKEQEEAEKKQQLILKYGAETASKILKGDYEIGMSKAVCKEIAGNGITVVEKTATTETWKISGGPYLDFLGDKLVKIWRY